MKKPEMIIFDYGHTLLYEPGFDSLRGEEAVFKYVKSNKNGLTPAQINAFSQEIFEKMSAVRKLGFELHEWQFQRFLYEYLEIDLSISYQEVENIFWDNASIGEIMPGSDIMIDYINQKGIRSSVISNIGKSGSALEKRLNRLLLDNKFEFVIASSEYMFRKPSPLLFELALKKAGLTADDVWFCGDTVSADIEGAASAGIFPVWYEDKTVENPFRYKNIGSVPACEHLHIHAWTEFIDMLEKL